MVALQTAGFCEKVKPAALRIPWLPEKVGRGILACIDRLAGQSGLFVLPLLLS